MKIWKTKKRRIWAAMLAVLLVWNLCPQMGFAVSAANTVSGNEATPSDASEATEDTEQDEFADGDLVNDLASPSDAEEVDEIELLDGTLEATPSDAAKEKAFEQSQTIDGITVRVTADEGVFPEDAILHVELVEDTQLQEQIQTAVEETTGAKNDPKKTVEKTMAFDITILDSEGNELQPDTEQGQVKVSFEKVDTANVEAGKSTLEVFHLNEDNTQAEKLDAEVDVDAKTVEVQAEHFSVYVLGKVATQADGDVASVLIDGEATTTYHTTLDAALAAATAAGTATITLLQNVQTDAPIEIPAGKTITLDLNGCTINRGLASDNSQSNGNVIINNGTLTIQGNGTITGGNEVMYGGGGVWNKGTLTIKGGNIKENYTYGGFGGGGVYNEGYLTIEGGSITSNSNSAGNGGGVCNTGTLTITGGSIANNSAYIGSGGGIYNRGTLTIEDGSITGNSNSAGNGGGVYNFGNLTITGGAMTENTDKYGSPDLYINTYTAGKTYAFSGGTFGKITMNGANGKTVADLLAEGYGYKNADGSWVTDTSVTQLSNVIVAAPIEPIAPSLSGGVYQIENVSNLEWFARYVNDGETSANAALTADLELDNAFSRIGTSTKPYTGTFDGGGHTVTINYTGIAHQFVGGLFDYVGSTTIKNLNVTGSISTSNKHAGGVVSYAKGNDKIVKFENVFSSVDITSTFSDDNTNGGIAACLDGTTTMKNCAYTGTITAAKGTNCGGLLGYSDTSATFENCYMAGTMALSTDSGSETFGRGKGITVTNCYYLNGYGTEQGTAKIADEFARGEVAWLMNGSWSDGTFTPGATDGTQAWYQDIETDNSPVLDESHGTVYKLADGTYSNTKPVVSGTTVQGHSLTLDGTIGVNFYVEFDSTVASDDEKGNYYVEVSNARGTSYQKMTVSEMLEKGSVEVTGNDGVKHTCYKITGNVATKEMTDTLTLKLMKTGVVESIMTEPYSVAKYYQEASSRDSESLKALTKSMVGYGAYAQQYFNYQTGNLPIALDQIDLSSVDATQISTAYTLTEVDGTPVIYYGSSLTLETDTRLEHYFQITGTDTTVEQLTFKIGDTKVEPSVYDAEKKIYYIDIKNIHAKDLELADTVTVGNGTDVYVTLSGYSPLTFIKRALEYDKTSEKLKPLVKALYLYWKKADTYDYPN